MNIVQQKTPQKEVFYFVDDKVENTKGIEKIFRDFLLKYSSSYHEILCVGKQKGEFIVLARLSFESFKMNYTQKVLKHIIHERVVGSQFFRKTFDASYGFWSGGVLKFSKVPDLYLLVQSKGSFTNHADRFQKIIPLLTINFW